MARFALILSLALVTGCAGVRVVDEDGEKLDGFRFYEAKPFVLVTQGANGAPVASVVTLPDLSEPRYLQPRAGLGKHVFSFKTTNGVLTEYGQTTEAPGADQLKTLAETFLLFGGGEGVNLDETDVPILYEVAFDDGVWQLKRVEFSRPGQGSSADSASGGG